MPTLDLIQASFGAGELSPSLYSRIDLDKYKSGLRTCRNFINHPQGGVSNRCGFEYIASARYSGSMCVTHEFIFNQTQAYVIEFGDRYIRFYTDGAQIQTGGSAYTVTSPYLVADLNDLRFEGSADVIFITHPSYQQRTLTRYADSDWRLETIDYTDGPFMPENIDESVSMSVSAVSGTGVTLSVTAITTVNTGIVVLLHGNGVDGSTTITDSSSYGRAFTAFGNAQLDTAQKAFGSASILFDGTNSYITTPTSTDLDMAAQDFTYGMRIKQAVAGTSQRIFARAHAAFTLDQIYLNSNADNTLSLAMQSAAAANIASYQTTAAVDLTGSFHELLVIRSGSTIKIFLDGISVPLTVTVAIGTTAMATGTSAYYIGASASAGPSLFFNGWIDEFITIKGTALETADYTIPVAEYSTLSVSAGNYSFNSLQVGGLFKLTHYVESQAVTAAFGSATTSGSIKCFTTWRLITHGTWTGKIRVEKSVDGGTTWTVLRSFSGANDFNADTSGTEDIELNTEPFLVRLNMYSYSSGTCNADLTTDAFYQDGIVQATAYISPTALTVSVLTEVASTAVTTAWAEGSFSNYRGWPSVARFFQDRLVYAATNSEQQTLWMTAIGNYYSFIRHSTLLDTDAITINLPSRQVNAINGLLAFKKLLVFTASSIWSVGPVAGTALTPTTVQTDVEEYSGSSGINPAVIGTEAIYCQVGGEIIRNIGFQLQVDGFTGSEANILAYHLFQGYTITKMAYQRNPNSILWCLRSDGVLLSLTYNQEQTVVAWAHHDTDGTVESICVIPGDTTDELWISVSRDNGRYIERMIGRKQFDLTDHVFMDSYTTYDSPTLVISSLTHLASQVVSILADDTVLDQQTVTAGGAITLPEENSTLKIQLLMQGADTSTTITDNRQNPRVFTAFGNAQLDTAQFKFGTSSLLLDGTGDYISTPDSADLAFLGLDFVVRGWLRWNSLTGVQTIASQYVDANNYWKLTKEAVSLGTYRIKFIYVVAGVTVAEYQSATATYSTGQWYYIEFDRSGSTAYFFRDGTQLATSIVTAFGTMSDLASSFYIGTNGNSGEYFNGWLEDVEVFVGSSQNTASYTAPTAQASNVVYEIVSVGLPYDADIETLNIEAPLRTGTLQGSKVKLGNVTFRLLNTRGGWIGPTSSKLYEAFSYADLERANQLENETTLGVTANFSGDIRQPLGGEYKNGGRLFLRQSDPLPITVSALIPEVDPSGKSS